MAACCQSLREALVETTAELLYYRENGPNMGQRWGTSKADKWFQDTYRDRARKEIEEQFPCQ
jgi:hypothetical protein